jgi:hypothetical protein
LGTDFEEITTLIIRGFNMLFDMSFAVLSKNMLLFFLIFVVFNFKSCYTTSDNGSLKGSGISKSYTYIYSAPPRVIIIIIIIIIINIFFSGKLKYFFYYYF